MYTIYLHTCRLNNKKYVGWTSLTLEQRWQEHINDTRRVSSVHRLFKQALKKYGIVEWDHEVLEVCSTIVEAHCAEIKWISLLKTNALRKGHVGYNMTDGGEGHCGPHSESTKKAISIGLIGNKCGAGNKGRVVSKETRAKISTKLIGRKRPEYECRAISEGMYGRFFTEKTRKKISESQKGRRRKNQRSRSIIQLSLQNELIATYCSIGAAFEAAVGIEKASQYANCSSAARYTIVRCCLGERDDAYGYKWRWA